MSRSKIRCTPHHRKKYNNYGSDAGVMKEIGRSAVKGLIEEEVDCGYVERNQAEVQNKSEETSVNMPELGVSAASNEIKTAPDWLLQTILIELFSCEAADDIVLQCFERRPTAYTSMNAVIEQI